MEVSVQSTPRKLVGGHDTAEFIPRLTRVRIVDGVLYFKAVVDEKSYWAVTGFLKHDPAIQVEFQDPEGRKWSARGTMETIPAEHPAHPELERALKE
jgi:hypothetical protein